MQDIQRMTAPLAEIRKWEHKLSVAISYSDLLHGKLYLYTEMAHRLQSCIYIWESEFVTTMPADVPAS